MTEAAISKSLQILAVKKTRDEGPSLLAADSEEEPSSDEASDVEDNRPSLLPLNEVIRGAPRSLSSLLDVMVPRLQQRSGIKGVSLEDQQSFVSILIGELSSQFSDLKNQIDDPFLSPQANSTLRRLVAIQVCRTLEDLYAQYTAKASRLCDGETLSVAAHMSRLRAQLAVQANKSINLTVIRRHVLNQLRGPLTTSRTPRLPPVPRWQPPVKTRHRTNLDSLNLGGPLSNKTRFTLSTGGGGSRAMRRKRVQKLADIVGLNCDHDGQPPTIAPLPAGVREPEAKATDDDDTQEALLRPFSTDQPFSKLERVPSMPELYGNFLLCDWKLVNRTPHQIGLPSTDQMRDDRRRTLVTARRSSIGSNSGHDAIKWTSEAPKVKTDLGDYTREDLNSDLHRLSEVEPAFVHKVASDDIDPLLQACEHGLSDRQKQRLAAHDEEERRKREEEERRRQEEELARREGEEAIPTIEDMEKMQFLRSQSKVPQSLSHSHASLHMRSNASDWQSVSLAASSQRHYLLPNDLFMGEAGVTGSVDQWSEGAYSPGHSGFSSTGGLSELSLSHSQRGVVEERTSLQEDSHFHPGSESPRYSSQLDTLSLPISQPAMDDNQLDTRAPYQTGSTDHRCDARTTSQPGSGASLLSSMTSMNSQSGLIMRIPSDQISGQSSTRSLKIVPRPVSRSSSDASSWLGSITDKESSGSSSRLPSKRSSQHGSATTLDSTASWQSSTKGFALQISSKRQSSAISAGSSSIIHGSFGGLASGVQSQVTSSRGGSASTIDTGISGPVTRMVESRSESVSTGLSSRRGSGRISRQGSASSSVTNSFHSSATGTSQPVCRMESFGFTTTPTIDRQLSSNTMDSGSRLGSEYSSRSSSATDRIETPLSAGRDSWSPSLGRSASRAMTSSLHGSATNVTEPPLQHTSVGGVPSSDEGALAQCTPTISKLPESVESTTYSPSHHISDTETGQADNLSEVSSSGTTTRTVTPGSVSNIESSKPPSIQYDESGPGTPLTTATPSHYDTTRLQSSASQTSDPACESMSSLVSSRQSAMEAGTPRSHSDLERPPSPDDVHSLVDDGSGTITPATSLHDSATPTEHPLLHSKGTSLSTSSASYSRPPTQFSDVHSESATALATPSLHGSTSNVDKIAQNAPTPLSPSRGLVSTSSRPESAFSSASEDERSSSKSTVGSSMLYKEEVVCESTSYKDVPLQTLRVESSRDRSMLEIKSTSNVDVQSQAETFSISSSSSSRKELTSALLKTESDSSVDVSRDKPVSVVSHSHVDVVSFGEGSSHQASSIDVTSLCGRSSTTRLDDTLPPLGSSSSSRYGSATVLPPIVPTTSGQSYTMKSASQSTSDVSIRGGSVTGTSGRVSSTSVRSTISAPSRHTPIQQERASTANLPAATTASFPSSAHGSRLNLTDSERSTGSANRVHPDPLLLTKSRTQSSVSQQDLQSVGSSQFRDTSQLLESTRLTQSPHALERSQSFGSQCSTPQPSISNFSLTSSHQRPMESEELVKDRVLLPGALPSSLGRGSLNDGGGGRIPAGSDERSSQRKEGEVESVGREGTSCEGSGGWEDGTLGDGQSFSDVGSFPGSSDVGVEEDEGEEGESERSGEGPQPQPAVITSIIHNQIVRTSDMCVSERTPITTLRLQPYKPIWNELTGELDRKTVYEMDSNLTEEEDIEILYHELLKTIPTDYLDMENEPSLVPAAPDSVDLSSVLASSSLPHRPSRRVANPDLQPVSALTPPWGDKTKREQWKKSNLYTGPDPKELMAPKGSTLTPAQARQRQQYLNWLKRWRATISSDDYLRFVAQRETDYLHHLYHLYDSEGSGSEGEEEKEKRERLVRLHSKLRAKQVRHEERYQKKTEFRLGMWNVNTVMMGGLGGDPESSGSSSEDDLEDQLRELEQKTDEPEGNVQERFHAVWRLLQLSQQQSMDMAVKYSSHKYKQNIRKALLLWERACDVIEQREERLQDLCKFEKSASDPSRLFAKGSQGSTATSRLREAKKRKEIQLDLERLEKNLSQILRKLHSKFGDTVYYKGRPYHEKMQHDRTEMLYQLQQERRRAQLPPTPP